MLQSIFSVAASQTDVVLVSALGNHKVNVYEFQASAAGTATPFNFNTKPGGAGTPITPLYRLALSGTTVLPAVPGNSPIFKTNAGEGLSVTTGTGATVSGLIRYLYSEL